MECRGTVYKLLPTGAALLRGADGMRYYMPRGEALGHSPRVGDAFSFDVERTPRGPLAVGAKFLEAGIRV